MPSGVFLRGSGCCSLLLPSERYRTGTGTTVSAQQHTRSGLGDATQTTEKRVSVCVCVRGEGGSQLLKSSFENLGVVLISRTTMIKLLSCTITSNHFLHFAQLVFTSSMCYECQFSLTLLVFVEIPSTCLIERYGRRPARSHGTLFNGM